MTLSKLHEKRLFHLIGFSCNIDPNKQKNTNYSKFEKNSNFSFQSQKIISFFMITKNFSPFEKHVQHNFITFSFDKQTTYFIKIRNYL